MDLRSGDIVEVLSESHILSTLDEKGTYEGLLFTDEMRKYCGKRLRVLKRVRNMMIEGVGIRQIKDSYILDGATCNGEYHMDCAKTCHFLWKGNWLKKIDSSASEVHKQAFHAHAHAKNDVDGLQEGNLFCHATSLVGASSPRDRSLAQQYLYSLGFEALRPIETLRSLLVSLRLRLLMLLHGKKGMLAGQNIRTPTASLDLQVGEIVEVKSFEEIRQTLDRKGRNRGLLFNSEMLRYCGRRFQVLKRVDRLVDEVTGRMRQIANTVILNGVKCNGQAHGGCPRSCYCLWREIWLRRLPRGKSLEKPNTARAIGSRR